MGKINISRYVNTTELKFEVEFITPAFLGGADGNAEIRTAPFKEGIRYWWRVLFGAKYFDIGKLKQTEDLIFGSTENNSNVLISIKSQTKDSFFELSGFPNGKRIDVSHQGKIMKVNILDYMAYGKYDYVKGKGNVYKVSHIKPKTKIRLNVNIKNIGYTEEIIDATKIFLAWGGVGSKSRNGFGSMDYADLSEPKSELKMLNPICSRWGWLALRLHQFGCSALLLIQSPKIFTNCKSACAFIFFQKNSTFRLLIKIISSVRTIVTALYHLYDTLLSKLRHTVIKTLALCYSFAARLLTF